jgi:alpha-ketoglutarate-dependent taurine dioxygenase
MQTVSPSDTGTFAWIVEPEEGRSLEGLVEFAGAERARLENELLCRGALLFRGWDVTSVSDLARFVSAFSAGAPPFNYAGGASPRNALGEGSYTSTEYPPSMQLSLHNELSYAGVYPSRLYFVCLIAPAEGGETTLGDSRRILRRIDAGIRDRFREKGVRYVRNLSPLKGYGYSWQEALETDDPAEAEACCARIGAGFEWRPNWVLRMSQVRPATAVHLVTSEEAWFNQADGFHPSALDAATYAEQLALCGSEDDFRLNVTYGDGSPIEREALDHVRDVIRAETIPHRWRQGDILVLDNLLAAHGRMPFSGPRKIALAMT